MMDDPGWAWPHWKFGLKRDDLFNKLHDQYNTIPSSIQDPEAFHHDVYEISNEASTIDDFHRLLRDRKQQRLRELNRTLESAACEIVANPSLIGTEQWQFALQLFRTRSLDSLVRYFASYLPDKEQWQTSGGDVGCDVSSTNPHPESCPSFVGTDDGGLVSEPLPIASSIPSHLPPSPRSMTMCSDSSVDTHHDYISNTFTPARTLSISGSESEHIVLHDEYQHLHDDVSQPCDPESPMTTISDVSEAASFDVLEEKEPTRIESSGIRHAGFAQPAAVLSPDETHDSDLATPKPEARAAPFVDEQPSFPQRRHRSLSPSGPTPPALQVRPRLPHRDFGRRKNPSRLCHSIDNEPEVSPRRSRCRKQTPTRLKPLPDPARSSPRGRRKVL